MIRRAKLIAITGAMVALAGLIASLWLGSEANAWERKARVETIWQLESLEKIEQEIASNRRKIEERELEIRRLKESFAQVDERNRSGEYRGESPNLENGIFQSWLERVDRLGRYQNQRPELRIPEFKFLKPADWLNAAKSQDLSSEAHYRAALAQLRIAAKDRAGRPIREALMTFLEESKGEHPKHPRDLLVYLDDRYDMQVMDRYEFVGPNDVKGMRVANSTIALVERQPLGDPVWNARFSIWDGGGIGRSGSPDQLVGFMEDAMEKFKTDQGREPTNGKELVPYFKYKGMVPDPEAAFEAMNTVVEW